MARQRYIRRLAGHGPRIPLPIYRRPFTPALPEEVRQPFSSSTLAPCLIKQGVLIKPDTSTDATRKSVKTLAASVYGNKDGQRTWFHAADCVVSNPS